LLTAALDLFRRRGFRGVGIDEVGEAVGITGSAVYRHFDAKTDILVDAYDRAGARIAVGAEEALARARSPVGALAGLTGSYARVALDNVDLIVVTSREGAELPAAERSRFWRRRRALRDTWVGVLRQARPDLSEPEARLLVATTLALVTSAAAATQPGDRLTGEVSALALAYGLGQASEPALTADWLVG
jgi:AcrR family transcriptional regulator